MMQLFLGVVALIFVVAVLSRVSRDETVSMPSAAGIPAGLTGEQASIESLVLAGRKIEAIKQLRQEKGLGLKEAKDEIDALARRLDPS